VTQGNVDGWEFDSGPVTPAATVNVLLADAFGNPVADGTPIVFQTNMGAIGSSDKGGCTTVNGGCSVPFRTQAPRVAIPNTPATPCNTGPGATSDTNRPGVATICASTTDGANTQFAKTTITFSDADVANVYLDNATRPATAMPIDLGSANANESKVFTLKLTDLNDNPLPAGTTISVTGAVNATGVEVIPETVPSIFVTGGTGAVGSSHTITVAATGEKPCTTSSAATFNVRATTPRGKITSIPFKLAFTCTRP
jgi:hypothetical protein